MIVDDYDGQMIFGEPWGLKLPGIYLTGEEKPRKNFTQGTCPDRGSNPGLLHDRRACYCLLHIGGLLQNKYTNSIFEFSEYIHYCGQNDSLKLYIDFSKKSV